MNGQRTVQLEPLVVLNQTAQLSGARCRIRNRNDLQPRQHVSLREWFSY